MKSNIFLCLLQSILLQLNNMSKNQQPTEHLQEEHLFLTKYHSKNI